MWLCCHVYYFEFIVNVQTTLRNLESVKTMLDIFGFKFPDQSDSSSWKKNLQIGMRLTTQGTR